VSEYGPNRLRLVSRRLGCGPEAWLKPPQVAGLFTNYVMSIILKSTTISNDIISVSVVSVFVKLSSNGRTGRKFAQGPGAQFAFFLTGHHFCADTQDRSLLERGGACSKRGWGVTRAYSGQIMGSNDKRRTWTVPARAETDLRRCGGNPMPDPELAYRGRKQ
jgi:hypothetical protein